MLLQIRKKVSIFATTLFLTLKIMLIFTKILFFGLALLATILFFNMKFSCAVKLIALHEEEDRDTTIKTLTVMLISVILWTVFYMLSFF